MEANQIHITEVIQTRNAILHNLGLRVFEAVKGHLKNNELIVLDFSDVKNLTSGFLNASIGKLYRAFPEKAEKLLQIKEVPENYKEKVADAIQLAKHPEQAEALDSAISQLFDE